MATIGRARAVAQIRKLRFTGFLAWLAWLVVHIVTLIGFRNRAIVLFTWIWSYFTYKRGARLITGVDHPHDLPAEPAVRERAYAEARAIASGGISNTRAVMISLLA